MALALSSYGDSLSLANQSKEFSKETGIREVGMVSNR